MGIRQKIQKMIAHLQNYPCLFLLLLSPVLQAQDEGETYPYHLSWAVEVPILSVGLGAGVGYLALHAQVEPLSEVALQGLDRSQVNVFDRSATYNWSPTIARVSDGVMAAGIALPLVLLAQSRIRRTAPTVALLAAETFIAVAGITNLVKPWILRPRPFVYNAAAPLAEKQQKDAQYAFFSGHTSVTTAMCFMTAKVFHDYNPGHPARPWVWAGAATLSATAGVLRHQAGKHFWTDIIAGYAVGAVIGVLVPELHRRPIFSVAAKVRPNVEFSFND